ncbi:MAG: hypothetical protein AABY10_02970 [Nanoarchaeota archaeon]
MVKSFTYGGQTLLSNPIVVETILPFLLVFTIVFAVLQKSEILGKGKRQIDAIVSLVIGLLIISLGQAVGIIIQLTYFLSVSLVIILVFLILIGSFTKEGDFFKEFPKGMRWILIVASLIAVIIAVLYITGAWEYLFNLVSEGSESNFIINLGFVVIMIGAIAAVLYGSNDKKDKKD